MRPRQADKIQSTFVDTKTQAKLAPGTRRMSSTEESGISKSLRVFDTPTLLFMIAALLFLYSYTFLLPLTPIYRHGDGLCYLEDARRMYGGEVMYRDFFEYPTPGTPLVYLLLFSMFGLRLWIPNLVLLLLGLGLAWLGVAIAKTLVRSNLVLLPSAIFLVVVYKNYLDPTHHWFSLMSAAAAVAVLIERRSPARIAAAGFLCGLGMCFTQSRGLAVLAGFAVFLWWESRRRQEDRRKLFKKEAWLVVGALLPLTAVTGYFIWKAGLIRVLWCTVVFPVKYYPKSASANTFRVVTNDLPALAWSSSFFLRLTGWLFVFVVIPLIHIFFFAHYWRDAGKKPTDFWERPMLLAIVGSFMFLSVVWAPAFVRMASSLLPGVVLLVWYIDSSRKLARALTAVLVVGLLLVVPHGVAKYQAADKKILSTPLGPVAIVEPATYDKDVWVQQHTRSSEYFYEPENPYIYPYLNLRNPTPLNVITNCGFTRPEQVAGALRGLEQHQPHYILWSPQLLDMVPDWEDPSDDHLGPMRDYIHRHYRVVKVFGNSDEVWEWKG